MWSCRSCILAFIFCGAVSICYVNVATSGDFDRIESTYFNPNEITRLISDSNLKSCINTLALKNGWLRAEEVTGKISCPKMAIGNLSGLEFFSNVSSIDLSVNHISDLTPLSKLTQLTVLKLNFNSVTNIEPLENLTNLRILSVNNNSIEKISAVNNLIHLTNLSLLNNLIEDIEPLQNLSELQYLNLGLNKISNIDAVSSLQNLKYLSLMNNQVHDISPISALSNIQGLNLRGNEISNVGGLNSLDRLTNINLSNNPIKGFELGHIETLVSLPNVIRIDLSENLTISCAELTTLTSQLNTESQIVYPGNVDQGTTCALP